MSCALWQHVWGHVLEQETRGGASIQSSRVCLRITSLWERVWTRLGRLLTTLAQQNTHHYCALGLPPYGSMCGRVLEASSGTPFTTLAHRLDHHGLALGLPAYGRMHGRVSREMCEVRLR